ncbi:MULTISPECIES: S41 family peptidase [unclassified Rickettsia]|uniref:S41 family peptidase n=1 Tax=unclassified Rickettsia TaxID=114295 RepID=UPI0031333A2F
MIFLYIFFSIIFLTSCQNDNHRNSDLKYIYNEIQENHPGIFNKEDPTFKENLKHNYLKANKAFYKTSQQNPKQIIEAFISTFNDTHLSVNWYNEMPKIIPYNFKPFQIKYFLKNIVWIELPNFDLTESQQQEFNSLLAAIKNFRKKNIIVFDLRGNQGGNSDYGSELINQLFGKNYATQQRNLAYKNVYVDWRVSLNNLNHVKNLYKRYQNPCLKNIIEGLEKNLQEKQPYYRELLFDKSLPLNTSLLNPVKAKIIIIIDEKNVSSTLDFIDELEIMTQNVILVGKTTKADRLYMELRTVELPSKLGVFSFPIKVYRNRNRGDNIPYIPDFEIDPKNTPKLEDFILNKNYD